ncbi:hypothetical protein [Cellulomonas sp. URHD0024]|uniref:hypothetical protein n=1 Tax=Cellulomonas sp. URHD0024 TaxID=1302620 RepID=UPI0004841A3F|nr:hypothetical protein [Cellulomonas sp. URHD0024]
MSAINEQPPGPRVVTLRPVVALQVVAFLVLGFVLAGAGLASAQTLAVCGLCLVAAVAPTVILVQIVRGRWTLRGATTTKLDGAS